MYLEHYECILAHLVLLRQVPSPMVFSCTPQVFKRVSTSTSSSVQATVTLAQQSMHCILCAGFHLSLSEVQ